MLLSIKIVFFLSATKGMQASQKVEKIYIFEGERHFQGIILAHDDLGSQFSCSDQARYTLLLLIPYLAPTVATLNLLYLSQPLELASLIINRLFRQPN